MAKLYKRGTTIWISYCDVGRSIRRSLKIRVSTEGWKAARVIKREIELQVLQNRIKAATQNFELVTIKDALDRFCEHKGFTDTTLYHHGINQLLSTAGNRLLTEIDTNHFTVLKEKLLQTKSHSTVVSYMKHLRIIWKYFIEKEWYHKDNPVPRIKPIYNKVVTIPELHMELVLNRLKETNIEMNLLIQLLNQTGLRISEALSLTVDDIDWNQSIISIHNTKADRHERFPIHTKLRPVLDRIVEKVDESHFSLSIAKGHGRLFKFNRWEALTNFKKALKELELPSYKLHDIRRTFATNAATKMSVLELKQLMRHKDIATTENSYLNLNLQTIGNKL